MAHKVKNKEFQGQKPVPEGFILSMESQLGPEESRKLVDAIDGEPSVSIRINRRKVSSPDDVLANFPEEIKVSPVEWCKSGFYLDPRPNFILDPLLHAGAYYVQEAASMIYEPIIADIIGKLLEEGHNTFNILDLCAAPGGKSTAILNGVALAEETARESAEYILVSNEFDGKRARILKENIEKWGDPNVIITNSSTDRFVALKDCFDIVAVDAPCSGEGMMRREPIARSQWSEGLVKECAALQREILENAVCALRPGGFLIYSTCTFNSTENESNVDWLKERHGLVAVDNPRHFMPHIEKCEGLFVAVFRKNEEEIISQRTPKTLRQQLEKAGIRIISSGTERTVMKGKLEIPSSKALLATDYKMGTFPEVELDLEEARAYLRRQTITLPPDTPAGFVAVCYRNFPLGLVKNLGNRANNLFPAEWRVLS